MNDIKAVNNKLIQLAKILRTLKDEELEKVLINRVVLDRVYLMRKNKRTDFELLETLTFRELLILEKLLKT